MSVDRLCPVLSCDVGRQVSVVVFCYSCDVGRQVSVVVLCVIVVASVEHY